jgi:hypothetical protein
MNSFILSILSGYSISIAAIIGLVRFRQIHRSYRPFVFICVSSFLNEIISYYSAKLFQNNNYNYNVYSLLEALLFIWLFTGWGHFSNKPRKYIITISLLVTTWISDNIIWHSLGDQNSLYFVVYSFALVFLAINEINLIVMNSRGNLFLESRFLICMGIVIFYTYTATIAIFSLFELNFSVIFYSRVYRVLQVVNIFINLVYALAILWAPRRQRFILPF